MSMVTRKLLTPSALAVALSVGLLAEQARATDEIVVYGTAAAAGIVVDSKAFRSEIDSYIRARNQEFRTTLDEDLKRALAPKLELASNELRARG